MFIIEMKNKHRVCTKMYLNFLFILINYSKSTFILIKKTFCDILFQNNFFFSYGNIHIYEQIIFIVRHI